MKSVERLKDEKMESDDESINFPSCHLSPSPSKLKTCSYCGQSFKFWGDYSPANTGVNKTLFCTETCKANYYRMVRSGKDPRDIANVNEQARNCGLSYGKYLAKLRAGRTYEELLKEREYTKPTEDLPDYIGKTFYLDKVE